jgi:3-oxoacyl-[acyl-carrier-protein] synthase III
MRKLLLLAIVGLVAGIALGFLVGWVLWPATYENATPHHLRQDYQNEYVLMVAASYRIEGNLGAARDRLAQVSTEDPAQPVVELAHELIDNYGRPEDIDLLVRLAADMDAATPAMEPYLEGTP